MDTRGVQFFSFWEGGGGGGIFCFFPFSHHVPYVCSHGVPQVVPNITSLLSHVICPKFNSPVYKTEKVGHREQHICFYFATGSPKRLFYWGLPNVPKQLVMGQSIWPLQNVWTHPWITIGKPGSCYTTFNP